VRTAPPASLRRSSSVDAVTSAAAATTSRSARSRSSGSPAAPAGLVSFFTLPSVWCVCTSGTRQRRASGIAARPDCQ
jgi:hypothetical protein